AMDDAAMATEQAAPTIARPEPATAVADEAASGAATPAPETASAATAAASAGNESATPSAAEPATIEVWRPGRPPGERRPKRQERERRRPHAVAIPASGANTEAQAGDAARKAERSGDKPRHHRPHRGN